MTTKWNNADFKPNVEPMPDMHLQTVSHGTLAVCHGTLAVLRRLHINCIEESNSCKLLGEHCADRIQRNE